MDNYDVVILGAGPAGLAAGLSAYENGAKTLIIERENRAGGVLKQCIHDGFGLITFKEKLSGPEYSERYIEMVNKKNIPILASTFVTNINKTDSKFKIDLVNRKDAAFTISSKSLVLANGCRERSAKQIFIHGTRPAGIYTAGTAQNFVNIKGYLPCKKCIILGSGDIGLIMARRLTLEGAEVIGVYEAKSTPSGLTRNIVQCLDDYNIPLHLSETVTRVFGDDRVEAVEISKVDQNMKPIEGTQRIIECDGVILSVGLIPENEIAESLNIKIDRRTKGPFVDQNLMTSMDGVFSCGNALHVNDLVDYVSESGCTAGKNAAVYSKKNKKMSKNTISVNISKDFLYVVPQFIDLNSLDKKLIIYLRSRDVNYNKYINVNYDENKLFKKKYVNIKPPEMKRIIVNLSSDFVNSKNGIDIFMTNQ